MTQTSWPADVRGFDWTLPPMERPPAQRTQIGYLSWTDSSDQDDYCRVWTTHHVLPDGGAEVVDSRTWESGREETVVEAFAAGEWEVEYPYGSGFGSRGGCFVRRKLT